MNMVLCHLSVCHAVLTLVLPVVMGNVILPVVMGNVMVKISSQYDNTDQPKLWNVTLLDQELPPLFCDYNGIKYPNGSFHPNPCEHCICFAPKNHVTCKFPECSPVENCIEFSPLPAVPTDEKDCCPSCKTYGCTVNETTYPEGSDITFPESPCYGCRCPSREELPEGELFLQIKCHHNDPCPQTRCVDPVTEPGRCCPRCPNGPNCYLDGQIIPEGEKIFIDSCRYCYCTEEEFVPKNGQRHATCVRSFFCI